MKFRFRLDTLMRQRKVDRDTAQRVYAEAQNAVQIQLGIIKKLYDDVDQARLMGEQHASGKNAQSTLPQQIDDFIQGQKVRIKLAREKARELMAIAEEKHEILTLKMQDFKVLERLKEKNLVEFKKEQIKQDNKKIDDLVVMRAGRRGDL